MSLSEWGKARFGGSLAALALAGVAVTGMAVTGAGSAAAKTLDELYAAARQEGSLVIIGPPSSKVRAELSKAFSAAFPDVKFEFTGMGGPPALAKVRAESRAGVNATDIVMNGSSTGTRLFKQAGLLQPLVPLMNEETLKDEAKWRGGRFTWADEADKTVLLIAAQPTFITIINTDLVKPGEVSSDQDLLNPKWKGKIVSHHPIGTGPGPVNMRRFYELYGESYVSRLVKDQEVVFSKDLRQITDMLAKGRYPIALSISGTVVTEVIDKGVKNLAVLGDKHWKEPLLITAGFGCVMAVKNPAHPAAQQLFINWITSRDGALALSKGLESVSLRGDVPNDHVPDYMRLHDGATYLDAYTEAYSNSPKQKEFQDAVIRLGVK